MEHSAWACWRGGGQRAPGWGRAVPVRMRRRPSRPGCGLMGFGTGTPKAAATLELMKKFEMLLMLLPAGRLVVVKKLGWPKVSRLVLSFSYVRLISLKK